MKRETNLIQLMADIMRNDPSVCFAVGNKIVRVRTGKITFKRYKCTSCGHESKKDTNHFGEIYPPCPVCRNKHHICLDPVPQGWDVPAPWKMVKLGDICSITQGAVNDNKC